MERLRRGVAAEGLGGAAEGSAVLAGQQRVSTGQEGSRRVASGSGEEGWRVRGEPGQLPQQVL